MTAKRPGYVIGAGSYDIEKYKQMAESGERFNPYEVIDYSFYKGNDWGQKALERDLGMLQYYADLAQQNWQNSYNVQMRDEDREYNSYANQVAMMRSAGLNPDLLGVSLGNSSSSPSSSASPGNLPNVGNFPNSVKKTQSVAELISTVGSIASDLISGGYDAMNSALSFNHNSIELANKVATLATDGLVGIPDGVVDDYLHSLPLSRSMRKRIQSVYRSTQGSRKQSLADFMFSNRYADSQSEYYRNMANPLKNPLDFNKDGGFSEKDWLDVWKPVVDAEYDLMKSSLKKSHGDNLMYTNQHEMISTLREPLQKVISNLKEKSDNDKKWATYALMSLYAVLSNSAGNILSD